jgi:sigma-B regulation protein RsbU (phosphoserine phosphatase)
MNRTFAGKLKGQFVTAAYVFLDLDRGTLRYSSAGHPPLLCWRAEQRQAEELSQKGLVLGARPQTTYAALEVPVGPSDRLVLYTDGLLEARDSKGEQFDAKRLLASVVDSSGEAADPAATRILGAVSAWTGNRPQEDDFTLVVVDVLPPAQPA